MDPKNCPKPELHSNAIRNLCLFAASQYEELQRLMKSWQPYAVVLLMSWTLCSGSMVSGQRRMQGAKTMARALADILLVSSCSAILIHTKKQHC